MTLSVGIEKPSPEAAQRPRRANLVGCGAEINDTGHAVYAHNEPRIVITRILIYDFCRFVNTRMRFFPSLLSLFLVSTLV